LIEDKLGRDIWWGLNIIGANKRQVQLGPSPAQIASNFRFVC
jgi:hypothetical protein